MSSSHLSSSILETAGRMQENMLAYFRLFAGLSGVTVADEDVFWFVNAKAEPGTTYFGHGFPVLMLKVVSTKSLIRSASTPTTWIGLSFPVVSRRISESVWKRAG